MKPIFVMIKCELGKAYDVAGDLIDSVEHVSEVFSVSGPFDLLVKCYLPSELDIGHYVTHEIQTRPNIADTQTIIAFNAFT